MASVGCRGGYGNEVVSVGMNLKSPSTGKAFHGSDKLNGLPYPLMLERELEWLSFPEVLSASEGTSGCVERKVMSLDLAMQRDLACRKKMEKFGKEVRNNFEACPLTVQGMASPSKVVGIKRGAPAENFGHLKPQVRLRCQSFQTQLLQPQPTLPIQPQPALVFCKECNISISGASNARQHYQGKKHKAKLEELERQKAGKKMGTEPVMCGICSVPCMNEYSYQEHLRGKNHAASLLAIYNAKAAKSDGSEEVPIADWEEF